MSGLKAGDCVLEVNGEDVLGLRITDIAKLVQAKSGHVTLLLWSCGSDFKCDPESICCAPMPRSLQRLATIVQSILTIIECPVCLDTIAPPAMQCQNGHLLCVDCRIRAEKCPVCRDRYTPQPALIAEKIYAAITSAYNLCSVNEDKLRQKLFGERAGGVGGGGGGGCVGVGGTPVAGGGGVKSRRCRRAEAAKQTIDSDQQSEADQGEHRIQTTTKIQWRRRQRQVKEAQRQRQEVAMGVGQLGRFNFIKDVDAAADADADADSRQISMADVTDVNAAKQREDKRKKTNLMKLWNGKAVSMENLSMSCARKIKPFTNGLRNSDEVIDVSGICNERTSRGVTDTLRREELESKAKADHTTAHSLQFIFSNHSGSNREVGIKKSQHHSLSAENNSDGSRTRNAEEAIRATTAAATTITITNTPMTMLTDCATINKTILNAAIKSAENDAADGTHVVNAMPELLFSSSAAEATKIKDTVAARNDLAESGPPNLPPPTHTLPASAAQQQSCKNNDAADQTTVKHNGAISANQQHVQPQWLLGTWQQQQQQQQQHLNDGKKEASEESVAEAATSATTTTIKTATTKFSYRFERVHPCTLYNQRHLL